MAGKPPGIASGSYVAWQGGQGRVDLIVTNGTVPGVEGDVEGAADSPAARVVVWEDGKPTRRKIGAAVHTLRRIPPIKERKAATVVDVLADHDATVESLGLPPVHRVTGLQAKTIHERGLRGWPGSQVTSLSPEEWATQRVAYFAKVAAATDPDDVTDPGNDVDLLPPEHPVAASGGDRDEPDEPGETAPGEEDTLFDDTSIAVTDPALAATTPPPVPSPSPEGPDTPGSPPPAPPSPGPPTPPPEPANGVGEGEGRTMTREELDEVLARLRA